METINGCTLIHSAREPEPVEFGPAEIGDAYRVLAGRIPAGQPAPPFHRHPHTDEAFHVADGECTVLLGDREVVATAGTSCSSRGGRRTPPGTPASAI